MMVSFVVIREAGLLVERSVGTIVIDSFLTEWLIVSSLLSWSVVMSRCTADVGLVRGNGEDGWSLYDVVVGV